MFTLKPLHEKMKEKGITFADLEAEYGIKPEIAAQLKEKYYKGDEWMEAVGEICRALDCEIQEVIQVKKE